MKSYKQNNFLRILQNDLFPQEYLKIQFRILQELRKLRIENAVQKPTKHSDIRKVSSETNAN